MREALLTLRAVVGRLGIADFNVPFRDFATFRSWWIRQDAAGSGGWQKRRNLLAEIFEPLHDRLADLEQQALSSTLVTPVSPHSRTGWPTIDTEISELRRHFQNARTEQDYRNVGNDSVAVIDALEPAGVRPRASCAQKARRNCVGMTKKRLSRFIEDAVPGSDNAKLRRLSRSVIEFAHQVKHRSTPTRRDAGIAADAVIQLANLLRRLEQDHCHELEGEPRPLCGAPNWTSLYMSTRRRKR